jgi:hypothetical protein
MENGEWRMENGEWRMENGEWRMENGEWRMEKPTCELRVFYPFVAKQPTASAIGTFLDVAILNSNTADSQSTARTANR